MKVYKFGGASVKNATAIKNVADIISNSGENQLAVIVSAIGKTTNNLEEIVQKIWEQDQEGFAAKRQELLDFHLSILDELFDNQQHPVYAFVHSTFTSIDFTLKSDSFGFVYDQIVSLGEVLSTKILTAYLKSLNISAQWKDARQLIRTNHQYREGEVDWNKTQQLFKDSFLPDFSVNKVLITQGFIGHTVEGFTTTLGREGSDYSAGILAYCCDAASVTIWKDVPGMLNADPKFFNNTIKLDGISYKEAIELAYYGASVIHPKTIQPLQHKKIPLYIKSFIDPHLSGTIISSDNQNDHLIPSFIFKMNQILFSFSTKDFSFIAEKNLSDIFNRLSRANAKINVMQNSALDFSILVDESTINIDEIKALFQDDYFVRFNNNLELITIRHYDKETIERVTKGKEILLEQKSRETARIIVR